MSNDKHVLPKFRHVLTWSDKDRMLFIEKPKWIQYTAATTILGKLEWLLDVPQQHRMPNYLIVGESNNGKTTLVRTFYETRGLPTAPSGTDADNQPSKPIVLAEAPPSADEKGLYISLLEQFYAPYRSTDPVLTLRNQTLHLFRICRTRVLIIDEFHSMIAGTARKQHEVMNVLKRLCNTLMIPIVGVGTRAAIGILRHDNQYKSRFTVVELPLWKRDREFQKLLAAFEKTLPLKKPSELQRSETARLLHDISGGNLGDLRYLLSECAKTAIETGSERIDLPLIKKHEWIKIKKPSADGIWDPSSGIRELRV